MTQQTKLKAHLVFGEAYVDVEGNPDEVFDSLVRFLSKVYPSLEVARRLMFNPDISELAKAIVGIVELTPDGVLVTTSQTLPARDSLILALTGAYIGHKLGILEKGSLRAQQLKTAIGKASKTVMNQLPRMVDAGLVEKLTKGEYRVTTLGLREGRTAALAARPP